MKNQQGHIWSAKSSLLNSSQRWRRRSNISRREQERPLVSHLEDKQRYETEQISVRQQADIQCVLDKQIQQKNILLKCNKELQDEFKRSQEIFPAEVEREQKNLLLKNIRKWSMNSQETLTASALGREEKSSIPSVPAWLGGPLSRCHNNRELHATNLTD